MASTAADSGRKTLSKADRIRDREVFHLFPSTSGGKSVARIPLIEPDPVLTALAQLAAIRLDVSRALINVITKTTQYTISEGTKTLDLGNVTQSAREEDALWIGCGGYLQKEQTLCQNTVELPLSGDGGEGSFIVPDLSQDPRFNHLFYVSGPPYWRFYIGTPLTTKNGIHIGALCILDDKPRDCLTSEQERFCEAIAQTIMEHLETKREAEERKKSTRMSKGLNAFVEGKDWFEGTAQPSIPPLNDRERPYDNRDSRENSYSHPLHSGRSSPTETHQERSTGRRQAHMPHPTNNNIISGVPERLQSRRNTNESHTNSGDYEVSHDESDMGMPKLDADVGYRSTFKRAANLLRESLDLLHTGGVTYLDTALGFHATQNDSLSSSTFAGLTSGEEVNTPERQQETLRTKTCNSNRTRDSQEEMKQADILGSSTGRFYDEDEAEGPIKIDRFFPLDEEFLQNLVKRYPRGKLFTFDEIGSLSSSDEEASEINQRPPTRLQQRKVARRAAEARSLKLCFPGVRQLIFTPLWDPSASRWFSGCFCWTNSEQQIFTADLELSFVSAYNNSVMAEVSRLATITADKSKGDFIGSISHELRSPLHGILASAEFLTETDCDTFQMSLISTIDSCGRTLLDTINHVLDYSKINSFERNWTEAQKRRSHSRKDPTITSKSSAVSLMPGGAPPLLNIYALVDVAAICEEVVEAVFAGQTYQDVTPDMTDISAISRGRTSERGLPMAGRSHLTESASLNLKRSVDIILDIEYGDYIFTTQPGALRRVIMNIFGNALKYTASGRIILKLELHDLKDEENGKLLIITVNDTGKGISQNYLKTRIFTPFAQENSLTPGTGLGLSIVRSITNMLGGSITIRSQIDEGTEVHVQLPLMRVPGTDTPVSTPGTAGSFDRPPDDSVSVIRSQALGKTVALYGFDFDTGRDNSSSVIERVIKQYITTWCNLDVVSPYSAPGIIIVDEQALATLLSQPGQGASIIVLCDNVSRCSQHNTHFSGMGIIEPLLKPFGPYKLAKAIRVCLERSSATSKGLSLIQKQMSREDSISSNPDTLIQPFGECSLTDRDDKIPLAVQESSIVVAAEANNAPLVTNDLSANSMTDGMKESSGADFPFPIQSPTLGLPEEAPNNDLPGRQYKSLVPAERKRNSKMNDQDFKQEGDWSTVSREEQIAPAIVSMPPPLVVQKHSPKLLLVDDNKINLRLLETFMRKRKYTEVDSAENGHLAVEAAEMRKDGYDIIFMDISMPILNGYEATRAIRQIERHRVLASSQIDDNADTESASRARSAVIIALTGLASSRDQSEAFLSGVDLFMTKPVSFKEVGKLLDNWEANGGVSTRDNHVW